MPALRGVQIDSTFETVLDKGPDGLTWMFSQRSFDDLRAYVEKLSGWRNSGEVDLLLVKGRQDLGHLVPSWTGGPGW